MNSLKEEQLSKISRIIRDVEKLSDLEKLYLYLQLPCGRAELPEGTKHKSSNGNKCGDIFAKKPDQETTQTYTWILSHLEEDPNVSLPKQEVYDEYRAFCQANHFEPLCVADFGKAMKHAFPCIKPRRLGQRGNSRYCYSGLRKKYKIESPSVPNIIDCHISDNQQQHASMSSSCCPTNSPHSSSVSTSIKQEPRVMGHHEQPQFNFSSPKRRHYEAINLKLDPNHHQEQLMSDSNNIGPYNNGNQIVAPTHSQQQQHDIMSAPSHLDNIIRSQESAPNHQHQHSHSHSQSHSQSQSQSQQNFHQLTVINRPPTLAQPQQTQLAHPFSSMPYGGQQQYHLLQRPGTPDDDDYRHNYQDLHRPIVSAAIPFSQTMPAQMACIPNARMVPGLPFEYQPTSCCSTMPNGIRDCDQQPDYSQQESLRQESDNGQQLTGQQQQLQDCQQYGGSNHSSDPGGNCLPINDSNQSPSNNGQQHVRQPSHHRPSPHHHPQHLRLAPAHLHLTSDVSGSHTSDLCASPFQSPASTPYPMIGSCGSACSSTGAGGRSNNSPYLNTPPATSASTSQPTHNDYYSSPSTSTAVTPIADCMQYASEQ